MKQINRIETPTPTQQILWLYSYASDEMKDMFFALADIITNCTQEIERVKALDLTQPDQLKELCEIVKHHEISDAWKKPLIK